MDLHRRQLVRRPTPRSARGGRPAAATPHRDRRLRCGRTASTTSPMNTSVSCSSPPSRTRPEPDRGVDVAADRLAVHPDQPLHRPDALARPATAAAPLEPRTHEPPGTPSPPPGPADRTAASAPSAAPTLVDPEVVPSLALRWSHARWRNSRSQVVPCGWRATPGSSSADPRRRAGGGDQPKLMSGRTPRPETHSQVLTISPEWTSGDGRWHTAMRGDEMRRPR